MRVRLAGGGLAAAIAVGSTVWAVPASAGGGCHRGPTQGEGDKVAMVGSCFSPNVLRVEPGAAVTFVNRDFFPHNLSATGWGHYEDFREGDTFRVTFDEPGVYPFACTYHPAMTGAVVVGNGVGAGSGEAVTVAPLTDGSSADTAPAVTTARQTSETVWVVGGAGGFILGAASAALLRRRRSD
ncbi:MAG: cupredoxin domain-containing protein [Actinomycetota bacterium]